jgi:hypothetical protein
MAFQRTRRLSLRSGRSLRSLGSPLNAYPLGNAKGLLTLVFVGVSLLRCATSSSEITSLVVTATDSAGAAMPGVVVKIERSGAAESHESKTDAAGVARFSPLDVGTWVISAASFGTEPTRPVPVTLSRGENTQATIIISTAIIDSVTVQP